LFLVPLAKVLDSFEIYGATFISQCSPNCESQFSFREKSPFGCDGYVTAVAAGQSQNQQFYSGMIWEYLTGVISVPLPGPRELRFPSTGLEFNSLISVAFL
jgi:hypothetical protein